MCRNFVVIGCASLVFVATLDAAWADPPVDAGSERVRLEAQYALRVDDVEDPVLDPVVFTEIVPFTADESAVRLPPDQDLE